MKGKKSERENSLQQSSAPSRVITTPQAADPKLAGGRINLFRRGKLSASLGDNGSRAPRGLFLTKPGENPTRSPSPDLRNSILPPFCPLHPHPGQNAIETLSTIFDKATDLLSDRSAIPINRDPNSLEPSQSLLDQKGSWRRASGPTTKLGIGEI